MWVEGEYTPLFGVPRLHMSVTRSSDIQRTPDIRTRAIVAEWAAPVSVSFVTPIINQSSVVNLLAAAGLTAGIGDWRPEKGKGAFGQFRVVNRDDPELAKVIKNGGRAAQIEAMENPAAYDQDSADLIAWATEEASRRGMSISEALSIADLDGLAELEEVEVEE